MAPRSRGHPAEERDPDGHAAEREGQQATNRDRVVGEDERNQTGRAEADEEDRIGEGDDRGGRRQLDRADAVDEDEDRGDQQHDDRRVEVHRCLFGGSDATVDGGHDHRETRDAGSDDEDVRGRRDRRGADGDQPRPHERRRQPQPEE